MKFGVLGTGAVGEAIASKLVALNHEVMMGSRDSRNSRATSWAERAGARAKQNVRSILEAFGWKDILDLGDISTARAVEDFLPLWFVLSKALGTPYFNISVVR